MIPLDKSAVYMCAIEYLAPVCRYQIPGRTIGKSKDYSFGSVIIHLENSGPQPESYISYNVACAVLRGLAEFMTVHDWWVESLVEIFVDDKMAGFATLRNLMSEADDPLIDM